MSARHSALALAAGVCILLAGCSVGRFIVGAPPPGATPSSQTLLVRRCTGCHEMPEPHSMSPAAWQAALERMKQRMRLPASEWDSLAAMRR